MNCGLNLCRRIAIFNLHRDELVEQRGAARAVVVAAGSSLALGRGLHVIEGRDLARQ
jgi:hypothetical protein